jgi:hypothetical protein
MHALTAHPPGNAPQQTRARSWLGRRARPRLQPRLALLLACGALLAPPVFGLEVENSTPTHNHAAIYTDDSLRAGIYTDDSLHAGTSDDSI